MSHTKKLFALAGMLLSPLLFSPTRSLGQNCQLPLTVIHYRTDGTDHKLMTIPVSVNGSAPSWFVVDTGAPQSAFDTRLATDLGLAAKTTTQIGGTGHGTVPAGHPGPQTLGMGSLSLRVPDPQILDLKGVPISADDRGLVGSELFERYVVTVDTVHHSLSVFDPKTFKPDPHAVSLPVYTDGKRLYLEATIFVKPGLKVIHRLRIDTGSEDSVDDPIVKEARTTQATTLGNGLGTNFQGVSGVYDAVQIGPYRINHVWGPGGDRPAIGMEMLRRFVVTYDVPHMRIYLRPTQALHSPVPPPTNG